MDDPSDQGGQDGGAQQDPGPDRGGAGIGPGGPWRGRWCRRGLIRKGRSWGGQGNRAGLGAGDYRPGLLPEPGRGWPETSVALILTVLTTLVAPACRVSPMMSTTRPGMNSACDPSMTSPR